MFVMVNVLLCHLFPETVERVDVGGANGFGRTDVWTQTLIHLTHLDVVARARDDACAPTVSGESPDRLVVQFSPPPTPPEDFGFRGQPKRRRKTR
jgi:hypothetical protein